MKSLYRLNNLSWLVLAAWVPLCPGQIPDVPVQSIEIRHVGPPAVSDELIKANIRIKPGDRYRPSAADEDVRTLYGTGFFYNVQVTVQETAEGIILTYILQGKPKLTDIKFAGNKKYSNAKLRKKVSSKMGEPLDEYKLFSDSQTIQKMYEKAGYPHTEVKYVLSFEESAGRGTVTFEIKESPKIKITKVEFVGAYAFPQKVGFFEKLFHPSRKGLCRVIKTREHWMFSWLTGSGVFKQEQFEDDREKLAEFYRDKGYIDFEIKEAKFESPTPTTMIVRLNINEGNPYKVGAVTFKGATMFPTNKVDQMLKMKVGEVFTTKGLSKDVERVEDFYGAQGHIDVTENSGNLRVVRIPNTDRGTMDLEYRVEEGQKSMIEKIEIRGNTKTKDRVIRRELAVSPGEVFDMVRVKVSKHRLEGLQYFEKVDTRAEPTDPPIPNRKNLVVGVEEKNTGNMTLGAGFSSVDSIVGYVEVSQANFDLFKPPTFTGGGQKIRLRVQMGTERQDYLMSFIEPWFLGRKLSLGVDAYHRVLNYQSIHELYDETRTGGRVGLTRALGSDFLIGSISYTLEDVGIVHVLPTAPPSIKAEAGHSLLSKFGASLAYDTRNNALLPDRGQRTEISSEIAGGILGDKEFYKVEFRTAWYFKGLAAGHVLELVGRAGVADAFGDTADVPFYERYYLGGISSLRGYEYRGVGPREASIYGFEPVGGDTFWFGSAEYSIPIVERVRLAVFYDIGMVYPDAFSLDPQKFPYDTGWYNDNWGIGLRLNLPIGPLRLDYGIPLTHDRESGGSGKFQFSVGYTREL
jgi:outer membrane protein insertion porin family